MLDCSKLLKGYGAGVASTVLSILQLKKYHHIFMCEIDPKSRIIEYYKFQYPYFWTSRIYL